MVKYLRYFVMDIPVVGVSGGLLRRRLDDAAQQPAERAARPRREVRVHDEPGRPGRHGLERDDPEPRRALGVVVFVCFVFCLLRLPRLIQFPLSLLMCVCLVLVLLLFFFNVFVVFVSFHASCCFFLRFFFFFLLLL